MGRGTISFFGDPARTVKCLQLYLPSLKPFWLSLIFRRPSNAGASNSLNSGGLGGKLAFLAIKLEQLSALQLYLPSLESFGFFWNFLILLELSVIFWNHLDSLRIFWIILKSFGFFWIPLESFGIFRIISESLGFFWYLSFRICGIFWILWLSLQAVSAGCLFRLFPQLNPLNALESFRAALSAWDFRASELISSCLGILGA